MAATLMAIFIESQIASHGVSSVHCYFSYSFFRLIHKSIWCLLSIC